MLPGHNSYSNSGYWTISRRWVSHQTTDVSADVTDVSAGVTDVSVCVTDAVATGPVSPRVVLPFGLLTVLTGVARHRRGPAR